MRIGHCLGAMLLLAVACGKSAASVAFHPTGDVAIAGGDHSYTTFTLPAGVTATVAADAVLRVAGEVSIAGNLVGDCVAIDLEGAKAITILGKISNACSGAGSKALILHTVGGAPLTVGAAGAPATLDTSGRIEISNDPTLQASDFLLPAQLRSATPLAPACAATADSVRTVATAGSPAPVRFKGTGAAPGGGGLAWKWDFGDGASAATQDSAHSFAAGRYDVVLTVTGDDKQACTSKLKLLVADGAGASDPSGPPGLSISGAAIVASVGDALPLAANAAAAAPATLTWAWDFGDGAQAAGRVVQHAFAQPGRYVITATAAADGQSSTATAAVYVHPAPQHAARPRPQDAAASCAQPNFNAAVNNARRPFGERIEFTSRGDVIIGAQTNVSAQDGAAGASATGGEVAKGEDGRPGGDLAIRVSGNLTLCDGAQIRGASGGDGGSATGSRQAYAGNGGVSGGIEIAAGYGLAVNVGANVAVVIGKGGRGGDATVTATDQPAGCTGPTGAPLKLGANAFGGQGGQIGEWAWSYELPEGVKISGGPAGQAGNATAQGGAGEDQIACGSSPLGKKGDTAFANSSYGGGLRVSPTIAAALKPGGGGTAMATGGRGGTATADLPPPCSPAQASGGPGGQAIAECLGPGYSPVPVTGLTPCSATAVGGRGGDATATGAGCGLCNSVSSTVGDAVASGAPGGDAKVVLPDDPLKSTASAATGGKGGFGVATGGDGGPCALCPSGAGHAGGSATSTGGKGGLATGSPATLTQGLGGAAGATGGNGGAGASCCSPPSGGGGGGTGGAARATAGTVGGADSGGAGNGGNGGDGSGPGSAGIKGIGAGTPTKLADGTEGLPGNACVTEISCASVGKTCAFACGHNATGNCSCGTATRCELGDPTFAQSGQIYLSPSLVGASFAQAVTYPIRAGVAAASPAFVNTIYGAAGQCVLETYSGAYPSTTPLDLGTVTASSGIRTVTAARQADGSYLTFDSTLWTAPGLSVTLAASGSGANAGFSVTGTTFDAFTLSAPTFPAAPTKMAISTAADLAFTFTGVANGSLVQVRLFFDASTPTSGLEVVCRGGGGSLLIPKELLQALPAASTGIIDVYQQTFLPVTGSGFRWNNFFYRQLKDPGGRAITNSSFQLTP